MIIQLYKANAEKRSVWEVSKYGDFLGPWFSVFDSGVNFRIYFKYEEISTRKNSVFGFFSRSVFFMIMKANDISYSPSIPYCMKSVRIWSYSGPHFPAFQLNERKCGPECCKIFKVCLTILRHCEVKD